MIATLIASYLKEGGSGPRFLEDRFWAMSWGHSIRLAELVILVWSSVKIGQKWPNYTHSKLGQKWRPGLFWAKNLPFWPHFLKFELQISFYHHFLFFNFYFNAFTSNSNACEPLSQWQESKDLNIKPVTVKEV